MKQILIIIGLSAMCASATAQTNIVLLPARQSPPTVQNLLGITNVSSTVDTNAGTRTLLVTFSESRYQRFKSLSGTNSDDGTFLSGLVQEVAIARFKAAMQAQMQIRVKAQQDAAAAAAAVKLLQ